MIVDSQEQKNFLLQMVALGAKSASVEAPNWKTAAGYWEALENAEIREEVDDGLHERVVDLDSHVHSDRGESPDEQSEGGYPI